MNTTSTEHQISPAGLSCPGSPGSEAAEPVRSGSPEKPSGAVCSCTCGDHTAGPHCHWLPGEKPAGPYCPWTPGWIPPREPDLFVIEVAGCIGTNWSDWFHHLNIRFDEEQGISILEGTIRDQAELFSILLKIRNLGLTLLRINGNC